MTILSQLKKLGAGKSSQTIAKALSDMISKNTLVLYTDRGTVAYLDPKCTKRFKSFGSALSAVIKANTVKIIRENSTYIATSYSSVRSPLESSVYVYILTGKGTGETPIIEEIDVFSFHGDPAPSPDHI